MSLPEQINFEHRYNGGKVVYTASGITFHPILSLHGLTIPWSNIDFVSPTPAVKLQEGGWTTFDGRSLKELDYKKLPYFDISIVLKNRHLILQNTNLIEKVWFYINFPLVKATYGADDKPMAYQGFIEYEMKLHNLKQPLEVLLNFFTVYSRYDLLCF